MLPTLVLEQKVVGKEKEEPQEKEKGKSCIPLIQNVQHQHNKLQKKENKELMFLCWCVANDEFPDLILKINLAFDRLKYEKIPPAKILAFERSKFCLTLCS